MASDRTAAIVTTLITAAASVFVGMMAGKIGPFADPPPVVPRSEPEPSPAPETVPEPEPPPQNPIEENNHSVAVPAAYMTGNKTFARNLCSKPLLIWITFTNGDRLEHSASNGTLVKEGEYARIRIDGGPYLNLTYPQINFYAITSDEQDVWRGDIETTISGKRYEMQASELNKDADGDFILTLTCPEAQVPE